MFNSPVPAQETAGSATTSMQLPQRTLSAVSQNALKELAEECVCPISQSLMVDPVIAGDGHSYDRTQIETWMRQQEAAGTAVSSPQTRELLPDTRLVSNLALKRTIERLVGSGRLDAEIVENWKAAKVAAASAASDAARLKSLSHAPIGTRIILGTCFNLHVEPTMEAELVDGSRALSSLRGDLHHWRGATAGLFGGPGETGRLLIPDVSIDVVARALEPKSDSEETHNRRAPVDPEVLQSLLRVPEALAPAPLAADVLLASVLPATDPKWDVERDAAGGSHSVQVGVINAVEHVVRRLATIENGLPTAIQTEWQILDKELERRRNKGRLQGLRSLFENQHHLNVACVVDAVDDKGAFTLAFPGTASLQSDGETERATALTTEVPASFIGPGAVVAAAPPPGQMRGGLFGGGAPRGGLFGQMAGTAQIGD